MAGKSPPQFKILNDTRDIVTLMTSFFASFPFVFRSLNRIIDNSASYSNLDLFNLIKNEQSQFLVEPVKPYSS